MKSACHSILALLLVLLTQAHGTSEYDYKPGEFLVIKCGKSPDKKFSVVAGKNEAGEFGIYLLDAPTKKMLGALENVSIELDTGPDAYVAHWSPDSKHVGVSSGALDTCWAMNFIESKIGGLISWKHRT